MTLPRLDSATVRAYLERLGGPGVSLDLDGLSNLLRAHLRGLPFHNLTLLRARHPPGRRSLEAMVEANIAGHGGVGHELTPSFVTLLCSLGFDASLAAANMADAGILPVGVVRLPEGRFVVDVGSGHPCLHPLPLDRGPLDFSAYGQRMVFERESRDEYRLTRVFQDGQTREVYRLTPEARPVDCFFPAPEARSAACVSPRSVQAVRMSEGVLATLREGLYQRFSAGLEGTRPVEDWDALIELLRTLFRVPEELLHPSLVGPGARAHGMAPSRQPLRFILSLASTGRAESVTELVGSIGELLERTQRPASSVGILLLENGPSVRSRGAPEGGLERARSPGLRVVHLEARDQLWRLTPFQGQGLLPEACSVPLPIGASRMLQTSLLWEHLRTGVLGLPHPGDGGGPVLVWMLDDDLSFRRLCEGPDGLDVRRGDDLLARAEELWAAHPETSVVLGSFTGDPPIPGYATFRVQVHDLVGNLRDMRDRRPDLPWNPGKVPRTLPDYYYDHARGSTAHLQVVFPWRPPGAPPWRVRDAFRTLCAGFTQVPHGRQVTRPLTHAASRGLTPSRNRGGNALFLDLDALMVAPYPVWRGPDGIDTRRADTLWAHLATREPLFHMVQADFDLLHGRRMGDGSSPLAERQPDATALRGFVQAQERGVVLARLLERGPPPDVADAERELAVRRELLARSREALREEVTAARAVLTHPSAWWWCEEADAASARACLAALECVESLGIAVNALEEPWLAARLAEFARHVLSTLPAWRATWA